MTKYFTLNEKKYQQKWFVHFEDLWLKKNDELITSSFLLVDNSIADPA